MIDQHYTSIRSNYPVVTDISNNRFWNYLDIELIRELILARTLFVNIIVCFVNMQDEWISEIRLIFCVSKS